MTFVEDAQGHVVAEITWKGTTASHIRIGDTEIQGTIELFDSAFVKILWVTIMLRSEVFVYLAHIVLTKPCYRLATSTHGA